jgi:hypothetical protein
MTPVEHVPDDHGDVPPPEYGEIDALLDGEAVDTVALRAMLDDPAACDYLVDALVLRRLAADMEPRHFVVRGRRGALTRVAQWVAAAAMLIGGVGAGYLYGHRTTSAPSSPGSIEVMVDTTPPAPAPTRSIRFEPGVNWTSQTRSQ